MNGKMPIFFTVWSRADLRVMKVRLRVWLQINNSGRWSVNEIDDHGAEMTNRDAIAASKSDQMLVLAAAALVGFAAIATASRNVTTLRDLIVSGGMVSQVGWASLGLTIVTYGVCICLPKARSLIKKRPELFYGLLKCQLLFFILTCGVFALGSEVVCILGGITPAKLLVFHCWNGLAATLSLAIQIAVSLSLFATLMFFTSRWPRHAPLGVVLIAACCVDVLLIHVVRLSSLIAGL